MNPFGESMESSNPYRSSRYYSASPTSRDSIAELEGSGPYARSPQQSPPIPPKRFIAIGIDFGTTFSGVSWAYSEDSDKINEVTSWPSRYQRSVDEPQVPSQINLDNDDWGYLVDRNSCPLRWIKLLLLQDKDISRDVSESEYLKETRTRLGQQGNGGRGNDAVVSIISRFLGKVWEHTLDEIQHHINASDLEALPFRVAITIPAIWPQYAREKMREAARRAGIIAHRPIGETFFMLVEEPEAAALATLFERRNYPDIRPGEAIVVCDAGGGTVDIISYKITSLEPFKVVEFVEGDGKLCGAFLVDEAFERFIRLRAGLRVRNITDADFRTFVNEEWEYTTKRTFRGDEIDDRFDVRPPQRAFSTRRRLTGTADSVPLKKANIEQFFAKCLSGTRHLISAQVNGVQARLGRPPISIILVGGLGSSRYMYNQLQAQYRNVLQPTRPWSAVARGATIRLLRATLESAEFYREGSSLYLNRMPDVSSRISKLSYGIECGTPESRVQPPIDRRVDRVSKDPDGKTVVWRMKWYLRRNETVDNRRPVTFGFYEFLRDPSVRKTHFKIYTSGSETPPVRRDESVRHLCEIGCDIDRRFEDLPLVPGTNYRRLSGMNLTLKFEGEPKWALRIGGNCVEQAVDVKYTEGS